ncbi:MAG: TrmH family RNA methyltransferase [Janthinobacterium lividum]
MPERIISKANARVRALRAALLSRRGDTIGLEGFHLLREAIRSGLTLDTVFVRDDKAHLLDTLGAGAMREVVLLSAEAFDSAAATEHAQGVAALLQRPASPYSPRTGDLLLVADALQDPGNLGTLIRSAESFGAAAVALTANTVDPWNGKCLRAAAGAAFRLPMPRWDDALLAGLRALGARTFAAVPRQGTFAHDADLSGTVALIIGNEGAGVSPAMLEIAGEQITLATSGPTESLNAAVAGSLLLYEASQQRMRGRA